MINRNTILSRFPLANNPVAGVSLDDVLSRIIKHVTVKNGCWLANYWLNEEGYSKVGVGGKIYRLHRLMFTLCVGGLPKDLQLDHLCRNRNCFNPDHLQIVSCKENARRGLLGDRNRKKTHCPQGHPYNYENTRVKFARGWVMRICRVCDKIKHNERYHAKKQPK